MQKYATILKVCRLLELGLSVRDIRSRTHLGHSTIELIRSRFAASSFLVFELQNMDPKQVENLFYPKKSRDCSIPLPDFESVFRHISSRKAPSNLYLEWLLYLEQFPDGYQYTQFRKHFLDWADQHHICSQVKMIVHREPGEIMYIDWVGDFLPLVRRDPLSDRIEKVHILVTTLGVSSLLFAKAFPDEKHERCSASQRGVQRSGALLRYCRGSDSFAKTKRKTFGRERGTLGRTIYPSSDQERIFFLV